MKTLNQHELALAPNSAAKALGAAANSSCIAKTTPRRGEAGVALALVIVSLLLITAIGAAMILLTNTETNVDANYRDEQVALYAAKAGLQEARDRMLVGNANPITLPTALPGANGGAVYIIASGVSPSTGNSTSNPEYDVEFANELNGSSTLPSGSSWYTTTTTNTNYSGSTNPLPYQWVRVNLKVDGSGYTSGTPYYVDGNSANKALQVYYDWNNLHECVAGAGTCATSNNLQPVYEVTSFAVTNSGTHRMLQDEVAAETFNLNFPSALTLPGPVGSFGPASSNNYCIDGYDGGANAYSQCAKKYTAPPAISGCTANSPAVPAVGVTTGQDAGNTNTNVGLVTTAINGARPDHYMGSTGLTDSVTNVSVPTDMSSPAQLDQTLQLIAQNSSVCLAPSQSAASAAGCTNATIATASGGNYSWSQITGAMPGGTWSNQADNPQIVYVDGNLDISAQTGSGILVVTGNLTYDGNTGWNGIIMVVGDGTTTYNSNGGGNGQFNGAIFVATTRDANGNQLNNFGPVDFNINGGGGNGLYYNSCWINYVQQPVTYKMLSSKEISH